MANFTRSNLPQIRADIDAALKAVAAKHGIDFTLGRIVFSDSEFRGKLTGVARSAVPAAAGVSPVAPVKPEMLALVKNTWLFGKTFDITKEYKHPTLGTVKVVGYNSKARQYPVIIAQVGTGKRYKTSLTMAKSFID